MNNSTLKTRTRQAVFKLETLKLIKSPWLIFARFIYVISWASIEHFPNVHQSENSEEESDRKTGRHSRVRNDAYYFKRCYVC